MSLFDNKKTITLKTNKIKSPKTNAISPLSEFILYTMKSKTIGTNTLMIPQKILNQSLVIELGYLDYLKNKELWVQFNYH